MCTLPWVKQTVWGRFEYCTLSIVIIVLPLQYDVVVSVMHAGGVKSIGVFAE